MKRYIILGAAVMVLIGGIRLLPAAIEAQKPEVAIISMKEYPHTETLTVEGTVEPLRKKELRLQYPVVPGEVFAEVGDAVFCGDILAKVDADATRHALLRMADELAGKLPGGSIPDGVKAVLAAADAKTIFEKLEIPDAILSPGSGTLTALSLSEGELLLPSAAAAEVSATHPLLLKLSVREEDIAKVSPGQEIFFTSPAVEEGVFSARVRRIAPSARKRLDGLGYETVVDVSAAVQEDFDVLRPGYSVQARIFCGEEETLRLLPYEAILQDEEGTEYVYIYREGRVQRRDIQTGQEFSTSVAVCSGISPYESVVLNASDIREDGPVRLLSQP